MMYCSERGRVQSQTAEEDADVPSLSALSFLGWAPPSGVAAFIQRCAPLMEHQLRCNAASRAFVRASVDVAEEADDDVGCVWEAALQFVQLDEHAAAPGTAAKASAAATPSVITLPCGAVSWNATGSLLAAAFGHMRHAGWCGHRAGVAIFSPFMRGAPGSQDSSSGTASAQDAADAITTANTLRAWRSVPGNAPPLTVLETDSCVTAVAFHPESPSIVAAGTFAGQLCVWDTNRALESLATSSEDADPLLYRSRVDDVLHRDPVSSIHWVWDAASRRWLVVSASLDGKILLWLCETKLSVPVAGFAPMQRSSALSRAAPGAANDEDDDDDDSPTARRAKRRAAAAVAAAKGADPASRGAGPASWISTSVSALAFPLAGQGGALGIMGTQGGAVHRCACTIPSSVIVSATSASSHRPGTLAGSDQALPWDTLAGSWLTGHSVAERNALARHVERHARGVGVKTVTMLTVLDSRPSIQDLFRNPAVFAFQPHAAAVHAVACSPFHRSLFATASADGQVRVASAIAAAPLLVLEPAGRARVVAVSGVAWSRVRPLVLACSTVDGNVHVYDLFTNTLAPVLTLRSDGTACNSSGVRVGRSITDSVPGRPAAAGQADGVAATCVLFNPRQRRLLAAGTEHGRVRVWKLTWLCGHAVPQETAAMERFVQGARRESEDTQKAVAQSVTDEDPPNSLHKLLTHVRSVPVASAVSSTTADDEYPSDTE